MKNKKFNKKDLIELLTKKAKGFYYTEEIYEYEKPQNKSILNKNCSNNLNFFEICDMVEPDNKVPYDKIELSNETKQAANKNDENLTLSKKKVSTHFVPPDMLAIKILFEIYGKEIDNNSIENLTDKELLDLKNKLAEELFNEYKSSK